MELNPEQQILEFIKKSSQILIVLPKILTPDSLASGLALGQFLQKQHKQAVLLSSGQVPTDLQFLPGADQLKSSINATGSLLVKVDTAVKKLDEISYETAEGGVQIYLKSLNGEFTPQDISFEQKKFAADLVIVLAAASLEDLGELYEQHTELFFEVPKINIDNQAANEYFGSVNLVDVTATAVSEILFNFFQKQPSNLIDPDMASCLLAGIVWRTHSFQSPQTTPKAFLKASELVALGARQEEIIRHIYKTKPLPLLKLWGRALARMKILEEAKVIYSVLVASDFEKAQSSPDHLLGVLNEFLDNVSGYKIIALLAEPQEGAVRMLAAIHEQLSLEQLVLPGLGQSKLLNLRLDNYKVVELAAPGRTLESLESDFLLSLKNLS